MYNDLLVLQGGACGCCGVPFSLTPQCDHNHETKKPRGLLCQTCNLTEGQIKKLGLTPREFADRLQRYLDSPPIHRLSLV